MFYYDIIFIFFRLFFRWNNIFYYINFYTLFLFPFFPFLKKSTVRFIKPYQFKNALVVGKVLWKGKYQSECHNENPPYGKGVRFKYEYLYLFFEKLDLSSFLKKSIFKKRSYPFLSLSLKSSLVGRSYSEPICMIKPC